MDNTRPIIRHCMNCKYSKYIQHSYSGEVYCMVKYTHMGENWLRLKAWLCNYYKPEGSGENNG